MTREELLADIDRATSALASRAAQQNTGTGIPRPPTIEVSESSLETQPFNFELNATSNAQAGAGGGGGPGGGGTPSTGACCYNDGTCDDIVHEDCVAAGGTFQGNGTTCADDPNPCLGVCCEEIAGCVDSSTPDSCTADGGDWQGFGTACDDDPPPCIPPCNGCGFAAYDGSGTFYLQEDFVATYTDELSCIGTFQCNEGLDCEVHSTKSYDADCVLTDTGESCAVATDQTDCIGGSTTDCSRCQFFVHFYDGLVAVTGPTTKGYDLDTTINVGDPCDPPMPERHVHLHYTLSRRCIP